MDSNLPQILNDLRAAQNAQNQDVFLRLAETAIQQFPQDRNVKHLLDDAEKEVVHKKLSSELIQNLIQKHDWRALQTAYLKLLSVFPESTNLKTQLAVVENKILHGSEEEQKEFTSAALLKIKTLEDANQWTEAEQACYELLSKKPGDSQIIAKLARIQKTIDTQIDQELSHYFEVAIPLLETEYTAHQNQFVKI